MQLKKQIFGTCLLLLGAARFAEAGCTKRSSASSTSSSSPAIPTSDFRLQASGSGTGADGALLLSATDANGNAQAGASLRFQQSTWAPPTFHFDPTTGYLMSGNLVAAALYGYYTGPGSPLQYFSPASITLVPLQAVGTSGNKARILLCNRGSTSLNCSFQTDGGPSWATWQIDSSINFGLYLGDSVQTGYKAVALNTVDV